MCTTSIGARALGNPRLCGKRLICASDSVAKGAAAGADPSIPFTCRFVSSNNFKLVVPMRTDHKALQAEHPLDPLTRPTKSDSPHSSSPLESYGSLSQTTSSAVGASKRHRDPIPTSPPSLVVLCCSGRISLNGALSPGGKRSAACPVSCASCARAAPTARPSPFLFLSPLSSRPPQPLYRA